MTAVGRGTSRLFGVLCATLAFIVCIAPRASADTPETGRGTPGTFITVTPSDNLVDQQTVQVSGTGFEPMDFLTLLECSTGPRPLCIVVGSTQADASGNFGPVPVTLSRTYATDAPPADCLATPCYLLAGGTRLATHHLTFAPLEYPLQVPPPVPVAIAFPPAAPLDRSGGGGLSATDVGMVAALVLVHSCVVVGLLRRRRTQDA